MSQPSELPSWATTGTTVTPSTAKQAQGWVTGEKVPAQWLNWWQNRVGQWLAYLKNLTAEALTWTAIQTFNAAVNMGSTLSVTGNTSLGGTLGVTGTTTLSGPANLNGVTTINSTLTVSPTAGGAVTATSPTSADAVVGTGKRGGFFNGNAAEGVYGKGAAGQPGVVAVPGTASTSTVRQVALDLGQGDIRYVNAINPASTTSFSNTISPLHFAKAWAKITTNGVGGVTLVKGCNIASLALSGGNVVVTFAAGFADADYIMLPGAPRVGTGARSVELFAQTATTATVRSSDGSGTQINLSSTSSELHVLFFGAQ